MTDIQVRQVYVGVEDALNQASTYLEALRVRINDDLAGDSRKAERAVAVTRWCDVDEAARLLRQAHDLLGKHLPPAAAAVPAPDACRPGWDDADEVTQLLTGPDDRPAWAPLPVSHRLVPSGASLTPSEPGLDTGSWKASVRGFMRRNRGSWRSR